MKTRLLLFLFSNLLVISGLQAQEFKCAIVDVNKLLTDYHVANTELERIKSERANYDAERSKRMESLTEVETKLKDLITKLREKAMPKSERNTLMEEYQDLVSQHNALNKDLQESDQEQVQAIKKKMADATRQLLDEIQSVIKSYAKQNHYVWIIDSSGLSNTQISPLVYARNPTVVTDEILKLLNKDAPKAEPVEENEDE
ncbi:OmpH family outer membrane protein [Verrucomicrobiaceae bacterium R5-34]|uniref:OmpH family outer membrane protein n=1 Tax=Oceaniferula flava TaxID=2800421 RepID=A0AAE2S9J3_9BACT|nr:OmpH family outer membrane protein [Oceaniferula flavus]MBK1829356.1 OmpH family outer membrane protein [Verrucomicrobiaceae bacterium R5-34]MBK1853583.1 OmpH family outer membrane protein [Oceaniferula flavus]MBM1134888.1 OmpH family outer membrane protein [Oceaniferula flavus]